MKKLSLFKLAWPMFVEFVLLMMLGFIDTFMLSKYNDSAAGAVSAATQISGLLNLVLLIVAGGSGVLIAQYIGAKKEHQVEKVISVSLGLNLIIGIVVSTLMFFFSRSILEVINVSEDLIGYASDYLKIVASFMFIQALMNSISVAIKSHGQTKVTMYISLLMNILNIIGDAVFIFGLFGFPILGVKGIAYVTVASKSIALIIMAIYLFKNFIPLKALRHIVEKPLITVKNILAIGLPGTAETLSFNLTNIALITLLFSHVGQESVIAQAYTTKILVFSIAFSLSIGNATQIMVGQLVGEKSFDEAYQLTIKNFKIAFVLSIISGGILILFARQFIGIFTDNPTVITIAVTALIIDGFLEPGRSFNLVFVYALRGAGDVMFPVIVGVIMGWGFRIGVGYIFGVVLNMGYPGFVLGTLIDEWLRGIIMMLRWRSKKWQQKRII